MALDLRIRRALLSVSDKDGVVELGRALHGAGAELIATGRTAGVLKEAGLPVTPIEQVSGCPEAFQGRMKTLSFPVFSGILHRRGDSEAAKRDLADLQALGFGPIDCVVVNFYPFEKAALREGISREELIEEIDIGGPALVRAAAKNAPDVLVLTSPAQYRPVLSQLAASGSVGRELANRCASEAWARVQEYDLAIAAEFGPHGSRAAARRMKLRYGENPHQTGVLEIDADSPIAWPASKAEQLTSSELSYNNILDITAAYGLTGDLLEIGAAGGPNASDPVGAGSGVVIVKHGNPCGTAWIPRGTAAIGGTQLEALKRAWDGDPVSAFGGVVMLTEPLGDEAAGWLAERFIEVIAAPGLTQDSGPLQRMTARRKNLKAVAIRRFGGQPPELAVTVPGGRLKMSSDTGNADPLRSVTRVSFPENKTRLARFGIALSRTLKSNAVSIVREIPGMRGSMQLIGGGEGQPNRIEAFKWLAVPRALKVLEGEGRSGRDVLADCILTSDAFFPFRDTVDAAYEAGIRFIVQPGGSVKDAESISACDEHGIAMAFTGVRHFKH